MRSSAMITEYPNISMCRSIRRTAVSSCSKDKSCLDSYGAHPTMRAVFADVSATALEALGVSEKLDGTSFYREIALN